MVRRHALVRRLPAVKRWGCPGHLRVIRSARDVGEMTARKVVASELARSVGRCRHSRVWNSWLTVGVRRQRATLVDLPGGGGFNDAEFRQQDTTLTWVGDLTEVPLVARPKGDHPR
jgi:hypothetical protein